MNLVTCSIKEYDAADYQKKVSCVLTPQILKAMKLTFVLLTAAFLQISAKGTSQTVTLTLKDAPLIKVFQQIENQTGFGFLFSKKTVKDARRVSIDVRNVPIEDVLQICFKGQPLTYSIENNTIVILQKPAGDLMLHAAASLLPPVVVKGRITNENGEPLSGATITEKGTRNVSTSNAEGEFEIKVSDSKSSLVISYVGYQSTVIEVGNKGEIRVALAAADKNLNEVVVVGYGTQKKSDIISSVASIKPEEATRNATLDVGEMLRGKAAGVQVTTNDAGPGGSSNIVLRGKSSISGGSNPIVIADGVPVGSINDINPNDIQSIEVLKDAAAQAIYGARASNGVILITTKRGKVGKSTLNYRGYYGTQTVPRNFDVYTGPEFAQLKREADRAVNNNIIRSDSVIFSSNELAAIANNTSIDWSKEILKPAQIQNHDLSFSAGTERTKLYVGGNFQDMTGVVPTTNITKGTLRINLDQDLTSWLKAGLNNSYQSSVSSDPNVAGILRQIVTASPLGNIYNPDGSYNVRPGGNQESFNPLLNLAETQNKITNRNDILNVYLDISPIKNFNNRINASRRSWNYKGLNYNTKLSESGVANGYANGYIQYQENVEWQVEDIITYKTHVNDNHFDFTVVGSASEDDYYKFQNSANQIPNDILGIYGLESALINTPTIGGYKRRLVSGVGRIQYDYLSKYYATLSARADGSSVFGADNKWGYFPAVALGWNIYKENFLAQFKKLSNLKLRASYGSVGNEAISPYGSLSLAQQLDYEFGGNRISGYAPGSTLANPKLKWETSTTMNLAIDFGFFNNRLSGTIEYYNKNTTDLLVNRLLNASIGYTSQPYNIGKVQNRGIELQIDGTPIQTKDLTVQMGLLFSKNKNKIISLYGDGNNDVANNWFIGQPIDIYRQPKYLGVWQGIEVYPGSVFNAATGKWEVNGVPGSVALDPKTNLPIVDPYTGRTPVPGTPKIEDKNGDGKINADDDYITSKYPDWIGSFNLSVAYKGLDLSVDLYTVQGVTKNNQFLYDYTAGGDLRGNRNGIKVNYWTPENPATVYPQPNAGTSPPGMVFLGLQDASYWRIQNITLGYTLPSKIISKLKFSNFTVYATAQNLVTVTDYKAYSPEQDLYSYPTTRNFIFGLKFGL